MIRAATIAALTLIAAATIAALTLIAAVTLLLAATAAAGWDYTPGDAVALAIAAVFLPQALLVAQVASGRRP
ncbi:hypothetical protein ABZ749_01110 [Micromonospora sp. NPDC047753]|uniref:hypothetical protein n=1 Tax=Micromonospora sp. NPDC047753 TaxID=3154817 RepID=UPI00340E7C8C